MGHITPGLLTALAQSSSRPNIVLIVADDHGTEAIGCYGNPVIQTPNLDQLAAEGVRFTNAFCTSASCSPSRTVILSGLHNHANGMYGLEHQQHHFSSLPKVESLPVMLTKAATRRPGWANITLRRKRYIVSKRFCPVVRPMTRMRWDEMPYKWPKSAKTL